MYRINVIYTAGDRESIRGFYEEVRAAGIADATRGEEGNLCYAYYFSADRENELLLMEKWEDRESQQKHDRQPHMAELGRIKEKYGIKTSIEAF